jgi:hypothetical protein
LYQELSGRRRRQHESFSSINHGTFFCRIIMQSRRKGESEKVFNQPDDETIMDNFINEIIVLVVVYGAARIFICSFAFRLAPGFYSLTRAASVN